MSKLIESLRGDMAALHEAGMIDQKTRNEFDAACGTPTREFSAGEIRELRISLQLSLVAFADRLGVTAAEARDWESGSAAPHEATVKLIRSLAKKRA